MTYFGLLIILVTVGFFLSSFFFFPLLAKNFELPTLDQHGDFSALPYLSPHPSPLNSLTEPPLQAYRILAIDRNHLPCPLVEAQPLFFSIAI